MSAHPWQRGIAIATLTAAAACAWAAGAALAKPPDEPPPPATPEAPAAAESTAPEPPAAPVLTGEVTREQIEESVPDWVAEEVAAQPDPTAARALAAVPPGAEVTVYLGTWCGDSKRELPRLWRALDETGGAAPIALRYVAVARDKKEPATLTEGAGLLYVPTFVVERDGREVGRIVEESPHGVERDLLALLDGSARGVVSARDDLQPPPP
ncbi:MAG TPA: hypothetical protein VGC93_12965 [Thermoanaerobaculia bacterium]